MTVAILIYLVVLFANIKNICGNITTFSLIVIFFALLAYIGSYIEENSEKFREQTKKLIIICLWSAGVSTTVQTIVPSEKTSYMMIGGYLAENVANSEQFNNALNQAGNISGKLTTIVNNKLDAYIKETEDALTNKDSKK